jgi:hypothetical protein
MKRIVFIACTAFLFSSLPVRSQQSTKQARLVAQEEDIREAVFLFLFDVGTGSDPNYPIYCLSVNSVGTKDPHDPSDSLMKRFPKARFTLRKASDCEVLKKPGDLFTAIRDKETGKPAWMISVGHMDWIDDDEVHAMGMRFCGGLCAWSTEFKVTRKDGKWKAGIGDTVFVSRARNIGVPEHSYINHQGALEDHLAHLLPPIM